MRCTQGSNDTRQFSNDKVYCFYFLPIIPLCIALIVIMVVMNIHLISEFSLFPGFAFVVFILGNMMVLTFLFMLIQEGYQLLGKLQINENGIMIIYPLGKKRSVSWSQIIKVDICEVDVLRKPKPMIRCFLSGNLAKQNRIHKYSNSSYRFPLGSYLANSKQIIIMDYSEKRFELLKSYYLPITSSKGESV